MSAPGRQRPYSVVVASFLGWTIDAFDFFLLVFVLGDIAKEFHSSITVVSWALTLTLSFRVVGALSNLPEFSAAFSCAEGTPMRRANACSIW